MDAPDIKRRDFAASESGAHGSGQIGSSILVIAAIAVSLYLIKPILLPFVVAGIVAYICTPLLDWLAARTGFPRPLFAVVLFLLLIGIGGLIGAVAGQHVIAEAGTTVRDLQGTLEQLLRRTNGGQPIQILGLSLGPESVHVLFDRARDWFGDPGNVAMLTGYGFVAMLGTLLTAVLLIWLLITGPGVARGLFWLVPPSRREFVARVWVRLDPILKHYFLGIVAIVIYATIAAYIGLALILGLDHALVLALLTGIAETLPFVGSTAVAVIAGLVALHAATGIMSIVAFAIYATVLRLSIDQLVAPLVLGRAANVHPVLIIFCFLAGGITFGIAGVILSVPVALTVKTTLAVLYGDEDG